MLPPAPAPAQQGGDLQGSPTLTDSLESELAAKRAQAAPDICTVPVTRVHVHASMTKAKVSFLEATVAQGLLREAPSLSIGTTAVCDWSPVTGDLKSAFVRFVGPVTEEEIREYFELAAKRAQATPDMCTPPVTRVHVHAFETKAKVSFLEATVAQSS